MRPEMTCHSHSWRGLPCHWCRQWCRRPRRYDGSGTAHLRFHSPIRRPGAVLVAYPGERFGHHLWTWLGARKRVRIVRAS